MGYDPSAGNTGNREHGSSAKTVRTHIDGFKRRKILEGKGCSVSEGLIAESD